MSDSQFLYQLMLRVNEARGNHPHTTMTALLEEVIPGHTTGLADYYLPTVRSMPELKAILVEVPSRFGPFGVKGLGEAAMLPSTPAIVNAISRAIGARLREIPATPERVLRAMRISELANGESANGEICLYEGLRVLRRALRETLAAGSRRSG